MENKTVQLVKEYGFQPRRKLSVEDGSVLPGKFEPFPSRLYGRPLEEIDNFIYDEVGDADPRISCTNFFVCLALIWWRPKPYGVGWYDDGRGIWKESVVD
jgi:hypothetical protein